MTLYSAAPIGEGARMTGFAIATCARGQGLIATRGYVFGEAIAALGWGPRSPRATRWTVRLGDGEHAEPLPFELRYMNHSCDPNVELDVGGGVARALRDVDVGAEMFFDYLTTERELAEPFACSCGSERCAGWIAGRMPDPV